MHCWMWVFTPHSLIFYATKKFLRYPNFSVVPDIDLARENKLKFILGPFRGCVR